MPRSHSPVSHLQDCDYYYKLYQDEATTRDSSQVALQEMAGECSDMDIREWALTDC